MQHPLPQEIANLPVRNDLDFNPGRDWAWPAVCEATKRALIALGGWRVEEPVAVVGAKGFIGKHLVSMLEAGGCRPVALDKDDSLSRRFSKGQLRNASAWWYGASPNSDPARALFRHGCGCMAYIKRDGLELIRCQNRTDAQERRVAGKTGNHPAQSCRGCAPHCGGYCQ